MDTDCSGVGGAEQYVSMVVKSASDFVEIPNNAINFWSASEPVFARLDILHTMSNRPLHTWADIRTKLHPRAREQLIRLRPPSSISKDKTRKKELSKFYGAMHSYLRRRPRRCFLTTAVCERHGT